MILIKNIRNYAHSSKPITKNKFINKPIYLHDVNTTSLVSKFDTYDDLVKELNLSKSTIAKYKDSGKLFRKRYVISSNPSYVYPSLEISQVNPVVTSDKTTKDKPNKIVDNTALINDKQNKIVNGTVSINPRGYFSSYFGKIDYTSIFHSFIDIGITLFFALLIIILYALSLVLGEDDMLMDTHYDLGEVNNEIHEEEVNVKEVSTGGVHGMISSSEIKKDQCDEKLVNLNSFLDKFSGKARSLDVAYENITRDGLSHRVDQGECLDNCKASSVVTDNNGGVMNAVRDDHMKSLVSENEKLISDITRLESKYIISELKRDAQRKSIQSLIDEINVTASAIADSSASTHRRSKTI